MRILLLLVLCFGCGGSTDDGASGGAGGAGGAGGGAGGSGGGACEKYCNGACVSADNPQTGCGSASCDCNTPHATAACSAQGLCVISTCDPGFANCDPDTFNADATGCETNTSFDPGNCGACGVGCTSAGQPTSCVHGACQTNNCPSGQADCGDGSCTALNTVENCGLCAKSCTFPNAQGACLPTPGSTYVCTVTCNAQFLDCDAVEINGCETNVANDVSSCGACGNPCNAGPHSIAICANGLCDVACDAGYSNCDGNAANGCEKPGAQC